jgi:FkbM family methyltransferase
VDVSLLKIAAVPLPTYDVAESEVGPYALEAVCANSNAPSMVRRRGQVVKKDEPSDHVYEVRGAKFYLPPSAGGVSRNLLISGQFQEYDALVLCDKLLPKNPVIVDIGANIGNHTIYWATQTHAKKIFSFEPMDVPAGILEKNIKLNGVEHIVQLHRIALSDDDENLSVKLYKPNDLGKTQLRKGVGSVPAKKLDSIDLDVDHVDLVKIDVEGFELQVLRGAAKTFQKLRPTYVYVEIWGKESNPQRDEVFKLMKDYGYVLKKHLPCDNYLFELLANGELSHKSLGQQ